MIVASLHSDDQNIRRRMYHLIEKCVSTDTPIGRLNGRLFEYEDGVQIYVCRTSAPRYSAWDLKDIAKGDES